jgi:putative ATP-binding cassette transporter
MGKTTVKSPAKKSAAKKPASANTKPDPGADTPDSQEKSEFVEVTAEGGDHVDPPPPEVVEPDAELSPEEAEQARKDYLLTRFWISARGYWSNKGDRLAWLFTIGLLVLIIANVGLQYGINVWNRARYAFRAIRASPRPCITSPRCSSRWRSAACWSAWRRYLPAWASSAAGAPG